MEKVRGGPFKRGQNNDYVIVVAVKLRVFFYGEVRIGPFPRGQNYE